MAKKKSRNSKIPFAGLICAVGLAGAGGGYFAGKNSETVERRLAALASFDKPAAPATQAAKPAPEPKRAETHAPKQAERQELARLAGGAEPKPPAALAAVAPLPPAKPELAAARPMEPASAKPEPGGPSPLGIALLEKEVAQSDASGVTLSVGFENLTGKPIRAFEGVLKFTDRQDNPLFSSKISVSALISDGATLQWDQHVDAQKLDEKGKRLVGEDKENLKAVFQVKRVFFVDGGVQKFGAKG